MANIYFTTRLETDGTWTVFHVISEELAFVNGQECRLLNKEEAMAAAHYLNSLGKSEDNSRPNESLELPVAEQHP